MLLVAGRWNAKRRPKTLLAVGVVVSTENDAASADRKPGVRDREWLAIALFNRDATEATCLLRNWRRVPDRDRWADNDKSTHLPQRSESIKAATMKLSDYIESLLQQLSPRSGWEREPELRTCAVVLSARRASLSRASHLLDQQNCLECLGRELNLPFALG